MKKSIEENEMPPASYKIFHSEARLTSEEKKLILNWVEEELKNYN